MNAFRRHHETLVLANRRPGSTWPLLMPSNENLTRVFARVCQ